MALHAAFAKMRRFLSNIRQKAQQFLKKPTHKPESQSQQNALAAGEKASKSPGSDPGQKTLARNVTATSSTSTLPITLKNNTNSSSVYCFVTGQAIDHSYSVFLLQADGQTPYYPSPVSQNGSPLAVNCAITMGAPGNTRTITIPRLAGARIWFSVDAPLTFLLNTGNPPGLVEPSVMNTSDPNYNINWGFAEFTYNSAQMYANISFVDFVSLPISLSLTNSSGATQTVAGLPVAGLNTICDRLRAQTSADGNQAWSNLIVYSNSGQVLRALSPNSGNILHPNNFGNYFDPYVDQVLAKYSGSEKLKVNINQGYTGSSQGSNLVIGSETFQRPTTADIFSSDSGPFATGPDSLRNTLVPQLAAAFNRSTLLVSNQIPAPLSSFYQNAITNHYSRIVHNVVTAGKGYAFPYDDVPPSDGGDQSGYVNDGNPVRMTITVGGI